MTDEEFDPICEVEFTDTQTGTRLTARLGAPVRDQSKDLYYCLTEIIGIEEGERRRIYADRSFEALEFALSRFRKVFAKQAGDLRTADGNSPYTLFPKEIPWVYGSDVYQRLCKMVDDEVQKIEDERTRRREGRGRDEGEP
ncbi:MAG: hypothetical protein ACLP8A_11205 [Methylovirgula sp.]